MVIMLSSLSSISDDFCKKLVTGQLSGGRKNSLNADTTAHSKYSGSDCSIKPHETEAADSTCKQFGSEAHGQRSLICDGCEAMYHFSCVKPSINEIPTWSWYCRACSSNGKDSHDLSSSDSKKGSLHKNCMVWHRLEVSETLADVDEHGSGAIVVPDCGESSVSTMESQEPPKLSRTA